MAGTNCTDTHTHPHRASRPAGTSSTPSTQSRTVIKTSSIPDLGATSLGSQFKLISNDASHSKRYRTQNNSFSLDDSAIMQITAKKHKDDHQLELAQPTKTSVLVQPTKTSTQNLEENIIPFDKYRSLKAKVKAMPIQISDKLKHLIPKG